MGFFTLRIFPSCAKSLTGIASPALSVAPSAVCLVPSLPRACFVFAVIRLRMWPLSIAFYTWYDNSRKSRYIRDRTTQAIFAYAGDGCGGRCQLGQATMNMKQRCMKLS